MITVLWIPEVPEFTDAVKLFNEPVVEKLPVIVLILVSNEPLSLV